MKHQEKEAPAKSEKSRGAYKESVLNQLDIIERKLDETIAAVKTSLVWIRDAVERDLT
jgi:hypothetical protein